MKSIKNSIFLVIGILLGTFIVGNLMAEEDWYNYSSIVSSAGQMYGRAEVVSGNTDNGEANVMLVGKWGGGTQIWMI